MAPTRRVAFYARVSTSDQRADLQLHDLRRLAEQRGWKVVGEYIDLGGRARRIGGPTADQLLALLRLSGGAGTGAVAGVAAARRRGARLGRPGFMLDVDRIRVLRGEGKSFRAIAATLGVAVGKVHETLAGRRTVRKSLSNGSSGEARITDSS